MLLRPAIENFGERRGLAATSRQVLLQHEYQRDVPFGCEVCGILGRHRLAFSPGDHSHPRVLCRPKAALSNMDGVMTVGGPLPVRARNLRPWPWPADSLVSIHRFTRLADGNSRDGDGAWARCAQTRPAAWCCRKDVLNVTGAALTDDGEHTHSAGRAVGMATEAAKGSARRPWMKPVVHRISLQRTLTGSLITGDIGAPFSGPLP